MNTIKQCVRNVFPTVQTESLTRATVLGTLPGWDSMNAINLLVEIESAAGRTELGVAIDEQMTLSQLVDSLKIAGVTFD